MKRHTNSPASVLAQLKNIAKANDVVFAEILNRYAIERILKRIELSSRATQCILKGGCLFILWSDGFSYRPTMDADLEIRGRGDIDSIVGLFHEVARIVPDEPDGISIDEESISVDRIRADDEYGGVRALMIAYIGTVRVHVQFDIGIGDAITPLAKKADFPPLLAEHIDMPEVANAVVRTFARRKTAVPQECPYGLTNEFAQNADKSSQWNAFIRKSRLTGLAPDLFTVVATIRDFYSKIIGCVK